MHEFFYLQRPISDVLSLNVVLLARLGLIALVLIPIGFALERVPARYRRLAAAAAVVLVVAIFTLLFPNLVRAADLTPCVQCDGSIFPIYCWFWWC